MSAKQCDIPKRYYVNFSQRAGKWKWKFCSILGDKTLMKSGVSYSNLYNAERGFKRAKNAMIEFSTYFKKFD